MGEKFLRFFAICAAVWFCYGSVDVRIGNKRTVLDRLDGKCSEHKTTKIRYICKNMTSVGKKILMNATFEVLEDVMDPKWLMLKIERCRFRENPDTCEQFHSFTTTKYCQLISTRSPLWSPFFDSITPKWECPIMKGTYEVTNAVFDVSSFLLFPVDGWFWKVYAEQRDAQNVTIFCLKTEARVTAMQRH